MKKFLILLISGAALTACSVPRHTYYFDKYNIKPSTQQKENRIDNKLNVISKNQGALNPTISTVHDSTPIIENMQVASTSKTILVQPKQSAIRNPEISLGKGKWEARKSLLKTGREFKQIVKSNVTIKEGNKRKNSFAAGGFIFSILGIGLLIAGSGFGLLFCALAIILSAIGLKSEWSILARIGLTLGIIAVALILFIVLFIVVWFLTTWQFSI